MRTLFCDQSLLRFGFSIVEKASDHVQIIAYGLLQLDAKLHYIERLGQIEKWLIQTVREYRIEQIVCEEIQFQRNVQTFRKLAVLQSAIETVCYHNGISYAKPLQVHVWRTKGVRRILQLPDGSKQTLFQYLNHYLNAPPAFDTNQADALGMAIYWCDKYYGNFPLHMQNASQLQIKGKGIG